MPDPSRLRLAIITNSPAPYRDQLYRRLAERFVSLRVFYTEPESLDRKWIVDEGCPTERFQTVVRLGAVGAVQPGVLRAVRKSDVVFVGGYEKVTYIAAMLLGRLARRRVVLFFDGIAPSRLGRRGVRLWAKRVLVRLPHMCLVNGRIGQQFFEDELGVSAARMRNQYLVPTPAGTGTIVSAPVDVLFVGRLIEQKGVDVLLEALRIHPEWSAEVVGDGPDRGRLEKAAVGLGVRFSGELSRSEVDARMRSAGCLVVPSRNESWGLVVHEAIQCDLAVVVSDDVGAVRDLVIDGVNGCMFPVGDASRLALAIRRALSLESTALIDANAALLREWSLDAYVEAFARAAIAE